MANLAANNSMIDYFESYMRKKSKKRYIADLRQYGSKKTLIEDSIDDFQQEINDENKRVQNQKRGFQTPRNSERKDPNNRMIQSKIMLSGQKKVAQHILNSNIEVSPNKKDDGQKEIFQNLRECFSFMPQQNLVQDKKFSQMNLKRKDDDDKKERQISLPPISQHYIDTSNPVFNYQSFHYNQVSLLSSNSNDKKISFKTTRKNTILKKFEDRPLCSLNQKNSINLKTGETDNQNKKCYTDFDNIKLDSVNIMNNSSFKSYDFQEVQKQAIIQQAEKQQQKEMRKLNNQMRGQERLNFVKGRQRMSPSPQEPFIGLVFQDYDNYTPIHSSNYRKIPLILDSEQNHYIDLPQSRAESSLQTITYKKSKLNKINLSFF